MGRIVSEPMPAGPISTLSTEELRERARRYREMALCAGNPVAHAGLLKLAQRFEALAETRADVPSDQREVTATNRHRN